MDTIAREQAARDPSPTTGAIVSADRGDLPVIALVGRPNVGKSTFLARASGRFVETANAPGTTVALERRRSHGRGPGRMARGPARHPLAGRRPARRRPVLAAAARTPRPTPSWSWPTPAGSAATCRSCSRAATSGLPIVVAANLADEAERRGVAVDAGRLAQLLAVPVHETCGRSGSGVDAAWPTLSGARCNDAPSPRVSGPRRSTIPASGYPFQVERRLTELGSVLALEPRSLGAAAVLEPLQAGVLGRRISPRGGASIRIATELEPLRWALAAGWVAQVERRTGQEEPLADRLARWSTSPWPGRPAVPRGQRRCLPCRDPRRRAGCRAC